jgi:protein-tyrosine kinase
MEFRVNDLADRAAKRVPVQDHNRSIGGILVEQGLLTTANVAEIQLFAAEHGMRFGEAALHLQILKKSDVESALAYQFNYPVLERGGARGISDEVVAGYAPQSESLESLRALRSQLILRWHNSATRKILAIVSPERREGRSWLAANLATMFAQLGERALLIDADMRHPRQHQLFNIDNSVGLSALLTGRAGREVARRIDPQLRLFVLPAGLLPPNPQELLERPVFDVVLDHFAEQFSIVIIDTPAATETADAQILASHAGGALMLTRRNHTRHKTYIDTARALTHTGANVIGTVISDQ